MNEAVARMRSSMEALELLLQIWNNPTGPIPWDEIEKILKTNGVDTSKDIGEWKPI